ncbi:MAG TPA: glycosyltransferase [Solirubrobacter sp.]|nr:glycosyltransferase [Solirubrobacter sp.]
MRVLCSTTPMEGAFGPFVSLGRALVDAGHEVMVATGPDLQRRVREEGFAAAIAGPAALEGAMAAAADPEVRDAPADERWRFPAAMFGGAIPAHKLPALHDLADEFGPDLVVHPPVDVAGPLLAAARGLPSACYGFMQPLAPDVLGGIAQRVAPLWHDAGLTPDPRAGIYRRQYLDPCPPSLHSGTHPAERLVQPIRPEPPGDPLATLPPWAGRLGRRPVLYVSLGTVPFFNQPARFRALLSDLLEQDVELVVTVSELHDPASLGLSAPTLHVERWLPLAPLLARCDAVLCHAGSGTTLAALAAGLPLVLVPDGADQFDNARACEAAGVARSLAPDQVSARAVRDAVRAVLAADAPERAAARRLADEIAAMPDASAIARQLEDLAARTIRR